MFFRVLLVVFGLFRPGAARALVLIKINILRYYIYLDIYIIFIG